MLILCCGTLDLKSSKILQEDVAKPSVIENGLMMTSLTCITLHLSFSVQQQPKADNFVQSFLSLIQQQDFGKISVQINPPSMQRLKKQSQFVNIS